MGALVALAPVLAPSATAAAPGYPVDICATLSVSTTTPSPNEAIGVTGVNFLPNADVDLVLKPAAGNDTTVVGPFALTTVRSNADGRFATRVTMPAATTNQGNYALFAASGSPNGTSCPADPVVRVTAPGNDDNNNNSPNGGPDETASTGVNVLILLLVAAALIGIGVVAARRGRTSTTTGVR